MACINFKRKHYNFNHYKCKHITYLISLCLICISYVWILAGLCNKHFTSLLGKVKEGDGLPPVESESRFRQSLTRRPKGGDSLDRDVTNAEGEENGEFTELNRIFLYFPSGSYRQNNTRTFFSHTFEK